MNAHVHLHLCMLDGVVAQGRQGLAFRGAEVDEACVERVQAAVRQRVVVFPKRLRYFLDRDADCLKRVAGIAMREVQRATAGASTSTAAAGRSGGVLFVHRFGLP